MTTIQYGKTCLKANLHTHTTCSDGRRTPAEAMAMYREAGYDVLCLTDHRKLTVPQNIPDGLLMLPGMEIDQVVGHQAIHILGIGINEDVRQKFGPPITPQETIRQIRECGGAAILAHPAWSLNLPDYMASLENLSAVEIWNSVSTFPYNADRADSSSLLDVTSTLGRCIPVVASDDCHFYGNDFAQGFTMIQAEDRTVPAVMQAIKEGRFYASRGPLFHEIEFDGESLHIRCTPCETISFYSNLCWTPDRTMVAGGQTHAVWKVRPGETFIRCQIVTSYGLSAWTRPFMIPRK